MPIPGAPTPPPPQVAPGAAKVGPAAVPQGNPGNTQNGLTKIKTAVEMLQQALPSIPMGTPLHQDILDVTKKLAKHLGDAKGGNESNQMQALLAAIKQTQQQAPQNAMARMFPQQGAPATPGGGAAPPPAEAAA